MVSPQKGSWRQPAQGCKTSSGRLPCTDRSGAKTAQRPLFDLEQTMTAENHSPPARSLRRTQCTNFWVVYNCALSEFWDRAHLLTTLKGSGISCGNRALCEADAAAAAASRQCHNTCGCCCHRLRRRQFPAMNAVKQG